MTTTLLDNPPRQVAAAQLDLSLECPANVLPAHWQDFLQWKLLPGAGLIMQAFYKYFHWDFRRYRLEGVRTSIRFIEERVRDDIRLGKHKGIKLDGYSLNSHLTKPILVHMLGEHPEWREAVEIRNKEQTDNGQN